MKKEDIEFIASSAAFGAVEHAHNSNLVRVHDRQKLEYVIERCIYDALEHYDEKLQAFIDGKIEEMRELAAYDREIGQ